MRFGPARVPGELEALYARAGYFSHRLVGRMTMMITDSKKLKGRTHNPCPSGTRDFLSDITVPPLRVFT